MISRIDYPAARRADRREEHFGLAVADPYRWLENDARSDAEVAAWVTAQQSVTRRHLDPLPGRDLFRTRLRALFDHERVSVPRARGGRYFHSRHSGLANQPVLVVRDRFDGHERVLIDPNLWSADGATALAEWEPSREGTHVAFAVQEGGTDWRTIQVLDLASGEVLADRIEWARFTGISWAKGGFFYSRYPEPGPAGAQAGVTDHAVWFHTLGTPQSQDRLVHATPEQPHLLHLADVTEDGRYAAIISTPGPGTNALALVDLASDDWTPRRLVADFDAEWSVLGHVGTRLFVMTSHGAERLRLVTLDLSEAAPEFRELVPEQEAVLTSASLIGGRLVATYLVDAKTEIRRHRLDGTPDGVVALPGIGTAGGFQGDPEGSEAFFVFTSYNAPTIVYRYDVPNNASEVWAQPEAGFDVGSIAVEQRFCTSKDGTRVPLFVVRRRDTTGPAPTILYGYGGFGISMIPYYSPTLLAWVEQGGAYAVANLRGGGEYGKAWHDAGRRENKQNVFDDCIAVAEYLKTEGIAAADGLAIQGESNGGLLVGAVVNQRPDLFAAALAGVGVMDMLRFHKFTGGTLWMADYGDPEKEADFRNLLAYSPCHNVRPGRDYPAILVTTAETDDRVVPGHSFKYAATLQAAGVGDAGIGDRPHLIRIETRAGHGAGKPMDKIIEEAADQWAFAAYWTGLLPG
ncbi:prolyl oligopeptidase family serine peptidase [Roseococcus sp.]|uniref:prolyl oligopeptidase family serine peptidase n=1 Tax=Roseococcus sp. TaxID=2109646 RepID=UPI003BA95260